MGGGDTGRTGASLQAGRRAKRMGQELWRVVVVGLTPLPTPQIMAKGPCAPPACLSPPSSVVPGPGAPWCTQGLWGGNGCSVVHPSSIAWESMPPSALRNLYGS